MGLYEKVRARRKASVRPPSGGLLGRSLQRLTHARVRFDDSQWLQRMAPAETGPAAPGATETTAVSAQATNLAEDVGAAVSRIACGIDAPLLLFETLAEAIGTRHAALFVADCAGAPLSLCACRTAGGGIPETVGGELDGAMAREGLRALSPAEAALFGRLAEVPETLWLRSYKREDSVLGAFLTALERGADIDLLEAVLAREEIPTLLQACCEMLNRFPPCDLESLDGVQAAEPSMMLSVSCDAIIALLCARVPSARRPWIEEMLVRVFASLFTPLGRIGTHAGVLLALLTQRSMDLALLAHQCGVALRGLIRSVRPLPDPVFSSLR